MSVVRFGENFKARPALEAAHVRIALDLDPPDFHRIFAGRAERRISTQRVVVFHDRADFRKQTRRPTVKSIAPFAIAATTDAAAAVRVAAAAA